MSEKIYDKYSDLPAQEAEDLAPEGEPNVPREDEDDEKPEPGEGNEAE